MTATRTRDPGWQYANRGYEGSGPAYLGWSHRNARLEMMDLPAYLDSFRQSYESMRQGYEGLVSAGPSMDQWFSAWTPAGYPGSAGGYSGPGGQGHHGHHGGDRECGCGDHGDYGGHKWD